MTLNDLAPPKIGVIVNFSRFRTATRTLRVNCAEMVGDKTRELAYEMFRLNVDFIGPRPDSVCSRRPAHAGVKEEAHL